jgi:hypothetical protein
MPTKKSASTAKPPLDAKTELKLEEILRKALASSNLVITIDNVSGRIITTDDIAGRTIITIDDIAGRIIVATVDNIAGRPKSKK